MTVALTGIYYFFFGVFASLASFIVIGDMSKKSNRSKDRDDPDDNKLFKFYMNIFFLNTKDMLENIVRTKLSKGVLRAVTKRLIVNLVKDKLLATKIGGDLCGIIPTRLENSVGIKAEATVVYQESSFLCIEVAIISADIKKVLSRTSKDPTKPIGIFEKLSYILWWTSFEKWAEKSLAKTIGNKLLGQLPKTVEEKLQLKLAAEIKILCCTEDDQGPFLINTIMDLKASASKEKQLERIEE